MAQKFSDQLRAAEDRIAELETESATYRERADRAEQWLHASTPRLKIDFFGRATAGGARRKGAERKTSIRLELIRNPKRGDRGVNALGAQRIYFDRNGRKARPCQNLDAFCEGARIIVPKKKADRAWHRAMTPRSQTRARPLRN